MVLFGERIAKLSLTTQHSLLNLYTKCAVLAGMVCSEMVSNELLLKSYRTINFVVKIFS